MSGEAMDMGGGESAEALGDPTEARSEADMGVGSGDSAEGLEHADALPGESDDPNDEPSPDEALHTVKVDGEEVELTLAQLKAGYSRASSATKRYQEAAEQKRQVQEFVGRLKGGDHNTIADLFKRIGVDFTDVAEKHLSEMLADMDQPEHVRGMRELERKRAEFERERQTAEERRNEEAIGAEAERWQQQYKTEMTGALTKHGLPASPAIVASVAKQLELAMTHDYPMTTEEAVELVAEETRMMLRKLPADAKARLLGGQAAVDQVQRADAVRVAAHQRTKAAKVAQKPARQPESAPKWVDPQDTDALKALFDGR